MEPRFLGKTVIVTGASSGIGEGCARRFAAEGANVVLAARSQEKLDAAATGMDPTRTLTVKVDVSDFDDVHALIHETIERFGQLDVLVSNAGTAVSKAFEDTTLEDWRTMMAVDVDSCFYGAKAALPYLKKTSGCIIHTASASGLAGDWNLVAYNAAKGAVVNFTRGLALDLGKFGIRVNAVAPSMTQTGQYPQGPQDQGLAKWFNERSALKGYGTPADVAGAVCFLASDDARFITGVILPVDGGVTAATGQPRFD